MCGRFTLFVTPDELAGRFGVDVPADWTPSYNVAPGRRIPTIDDDGFRLRCWGFVPNWADDPDGGHSNARAESIEDRQSFRTAVDRRRCLVPADGFYEWTDVEGRRQPYRIVREDDRPFAMAGIWERWEGRPEQVALDDFAGDSAEPETEVRETVAIVTTDARAPVADVHERMPAILEPDREHDWLAAEDATDRERLLEPRPLDAFRAYRVSTAVNDPANDAPDLIEPLDG